MTARLSYLMLASLDGYIEDESGDFEWAAPSDEVHQFVNDLMRPVGIHLYGRRMYETMAVWETEPEMWRGQPVAEDFAAIWQAADKVVYSTTLATTSTSRTRVERHFDPGGLADLKASADADLGIGGPTLAAEAFRAGLVDECQIFLVPVAVGGGKPALPPHLRVPLHLLDHRRFEDGTVFLRYRVDR
jgi:dihydrofolate reductase